MTPLFSSITTPLLKVSITSLGTHYTGGHMQPYVAHRPPPCGVTRVITRHTQPETRHKKNRHSAWYNFWPGMYATNAQQGIEQQIETLQPSNHLLSTTLLVPRQRPHLTVI